MTQNHTQTLANIIQQIIEAKDIVKLMPTQKYNNLMEKLTEIVDDVLQNNDLRIINGKIHEFELLIQ